MDNPFLVANDAFLSVKEGNYLLPLRNLSKLKHNYQHTNEKQMLWQAFCNYHSLVGEADSVNYYWEQIMALTQSKPRKFLEVHPEPSTDYILNRAAKNRITIFNESHILPKHRYFVGTLLKDFYDRGYRYLALEALAESDTINQFGYVTQHSGFYTREPIMANLCRHAREVGYTLLSYDTMGGDREMMQAQNIFDKTLRIDKHAKVIVLAGHGHVNEDSLVSHKMMAFHLKNTSGIDPLTINQTELEWLRMDDRDNEVWYYDLSKDFVYRPVMKNDLYVFNNIDITAEDFTPFFEKTRFVKVQNELIGNAGKDNLVLHVYSKAEMVIENPVPVYTKLLGTKCPPDLTLKLPAGMYIIRIKNTFGDNLWEKELAVSVSHDD